MAVFGKKACRLSKTQDPTYMYRIVSAACPIIVYTFYLFYPIKLCYNYLAKYSYY